jgi:hypothetical protein
MIDHSDAVTFIEFLFEPDDLIEFRLIGAREPKSIPRFMARNEAISKLADFDSVNCAPEWRNIYASVCPRNGKGGTKAHTARARVLWADLDNGATPTDAVERIRAVGLPDPSCVIKSGHGVHCYWKLDKPIEFKSNDDRDLIEAAVRSINDRIGGDHVHDVSRVMRVPGFMNVKGADKGEEPVPCVISYCNDDTFKLEDFTTQNVQTVKRKPVPPPPNDKQGIARANAFMNLHEAEVSSRNASANGNKSYRSELDFKALCFLSEAGIPVEEAWALVRERSKFKESGRPYFDRTWKKVCQSGKRAKTAKKPVRSFQPFRPFPIHTLPRDVRTFVEAVSVATGTETAFAALAALVVLAGCVGNRFVALIKYGWTEPSVLWGMLIARSGFTKSPVLKLVLQALVEIYKRDRAEFNEAVQEYEREVARFEVDLAEWKKRQKEGAETDPPERPKRPIEKRVRVNDVTIEKLGCLLEENPLGLLLALDELPAWIGSFDRYAGGKGSDAANWLSMFDAGSIQVDRKGNPKSLFVEFAAVSVLGGIQPGTLRRVFGVAERESGLLARCLVTYPPERPAKWNDGELSESVAGRWREILEALLAERPHFDAEGNPYPRNMPLALDAKELFVRWHNTHMAEVAEVCDDDLQAHLAKLKGICVRFATIIQCVMGVGGGSGVGDTTTCVTCEAMAHAIEITEWFKHEARRVYAILCEGDVEREQRELIEWIARRGGSCTVRDLTHNVRKWRGESDAAREQLNSLVEAGLGHWEQSDPGPGRPTERFVLHEGVTSVTDTKNQADEGVATGIGDDDGDPTSFNFGFNSICAYRQSEEVKDGDNGASNA